MQLSQKAPQSPPQPFERSLSRPRIEQSVLMVRNTPSDFHKIDHLLAYVQRLRTTEATICFGLPKPEHGCWSLFSQCL